MQRRIRPAASARLICVLGSLAVVTSLLLVLAGRPVGTDDLWFHLAMGKVYATETLWPESDPMLHTAGDRRPVQHEWLFGVAVFGIERALGLHGLRVVHVLVVAGILALAFASFRREAAALLPAAFATCVFAILSWQRLQQLRPDLVSIPAAIGLCGLLLGARPGPSWRRVAIAIGMLLVWANAHSLFLAGVALVTAGLAGVGAARLLARRLPAHERPPPLPDAPRVAAAIGLGLLAALCNPRGIHQHLTFLQSATTSAIWLVRDEWTRFDPFRLPDARSAGIDLASWATTEGLLLVFLAAAITGGLAFLRRPAAWRLRAADPVLGALALAGACALLSSTRFLWMGFFPLLFLLRAGRELLAARPAPRPALEWAMAGLALALAAGFARMDLWQGLAFEARREPGGYLRAPALRHRYFEGGIRFLEETALEGSLFNPYHAGGYAGYRLAPRIRTFIDGRTEHYPPEIARDYLEVVGSPAGADRSRALAILDERRVDLFLGVGLPEAGYYGELHTVDLLAGHPDWLLVYRTVDHSVYLRRDMRNAENLQRVFDYYRARGVPFDPRRGLAPRDVIREARAWAIAQEMIPPDFPRPDAEARSADPDQRFHILDARARAYWLLGELRAQIEADQAAIALRPDAREPRRRLANAYLRGRRIREAERLARELYEADPDDERSRALYRFVISQRHTWR